ncbi:MAG: hypothetical protein M1132_07785 [Chloroflexi bacterium]|nr:hypothetical protein [Chloroflexota bacterium]
MTAIPEEIVARFIHTSLDLEWTIITALQGEEDSASPQLRSWVNAIGDTNRAAVILSSEIARRRLEAVSHQDSIVPALPYSHPDLAGVAVDEEMMVRARDFDTTNQAFERGQTAFHIMPSLPASNSMYWANRVLIELYTTHDVRVRLDPFMLTEREQVGVPLYKMWVYGKPLDWNELEELNEDRHAKWRPEYASHEGSNFTDLVWSPRPDGIHFRCEEVPRAEAVSERGGRYLHAIYNPALKAFTHTDGAIRIYSPAELEGRSSTHVRKAGKVGKRVKIFKVIGNIEREVWCNLAGSFFVWNDDVQAYFRKQ